MKSGVLVWKRYSVIDYRLHSGQCIAEQVWRKDFEARAVLVFMYIGSSFL